jgi:MFS family permease
MGYLLSAFSKPMLAFFKFPLWIFFARTIDRLGKGVRTGARDALLSEESTPETKGRVFGFHRGMDTLGAVLGPTMALIFLAFHPGNYRFLFLIAFFPGLLAIMFTFFLKEKRSEEPGKKQKISFFTFLKYWNSSPAIYRKLVIGLLVFALFNSSDVFLLLKLKESGLDDSKVIGAYIFYNLVYALFSFPFGILADKIGLKKVFIAGLILFSVVYFGMGITTGFAGFVVLFFVYGIYASATEGISKAWITNIAGKNETATAIGTYTAFQSISTMLASTLAGLIWIKYGAVTMFALSAGMALLVAVYLLIVTKKTA